MNQHSIYLLAQEVLWAAAVFPPGGEAYGLHWWKGSSHVGLREYLLDAFVRYIFVGFADIYWPPQKIKNAAQTYFGQLLSSV